MLIGRTTVPSLYKHGLSCKMESLCGFTRFLFAVKSVCLLANIRFRTNAGAFRKNKKLEIPTQVPIKRPGLTMD